MPADNQRKVLRYTLSFRLNGTVGMLHKYFNEPQECLDYIKYTLENDGSIKGLQYDWMEEYNEQRL